MKTQLSIDELRRQLTRYVKDYPQTFKERDWWRPPLLATARADERFEILPRVAADNHWLPKDLMASARTVVVFFIPFKAELAEENHPGKFPCPNWGIAYEVTNQLIEKACAHLRGVLAEYGYEAVLTPATENFDKERLVARWSHKHLGYVAGLGRFGVNAQFITPSGCAGRMGSLVTDADVGDHPLVAQAELCLHKVGRECLQCVVRCPVKAVSIEGVDRHRCNKRLDFNWKNRIKLGLGERSHGCAKCQVNLPCSLTDPTSMESTQEACQKSAI
ncbi:MAG: epoxyqueuosine reductase [Thermodesulfobacteriota bacterium]